MAGKTHAGSWSDPGANDGRLFKPSDFGGLCRRCSNRLLRVLEDEGMQTHPACDPAMPGLLRASAIARNRSTPSTPTERNTR